MPKTKCAPAYQLHRGTGQAKVRIDGRDHYLGLHGSAESQDRYDELIRAWRRRKDLCSVTLTVDELSIRFMDHAENYYLRKDGTPTPELASLRHALRPVIQRFGNCRVREFGPLKLKEVRRSLIDDGHCRTNINRMVDRIRRLFVWGVENELVPPELLQALRAVPGLRAGRTKARESDPVMPVEAAVVDATLEHLPPTVADMVRLQLLTGARPGEICSMRPGDVERGPQVWTYRPTQHKTLHRGKERRIFIGPQGQRILAPYLLRPTDSYCFSPADSERKRNSERKANRRSRMTPSQSARKSKGRNIQNRYTKDAYNRAVKRACEAAFAMPAELRDIGRTVKRMKDVSDAERKAERERIAKEASDWRAKHCWSPNQLRHSRATQLREKYGIEAAQVVLGHSDPKTTLVYAETQFSKAAEIARAIG